MTTRRNFDPVRDWRGLERRYVERLSQRWWIGGMILLYASATALFCGAGLWSWHGFRWFYPCLIVAGVAGIMAAACRLRLAAEAADELDARNYRRASRLIHD